MQNRNNGSYAPARSSLREQSRELVSNLDTLFHRLLFSRITPAPDIDLSRQDLRALDILRRRGSLTMTDFSADLGTPTSTATHAVDRLVKKGLVMRVRSEIDRRVVHVTLSDAGREMEKMHWKLRLAMAQDMLHPLTLDERETFLELMTKMSRLATLNNSKASSV